MSRAKSTKLALLVISTLMVSSATAQQNNIDFVDVLSSGLKKLLTQKNQESESSYQVKDNIQNIIHGEEQQTSDSYIYQPRYLSEKQNSQFQDDEDLLLQQSETSPVVPWVDRTSYQQYLLIGNAFFSGATANQYAANSTNCYNRTLYVVYKSTLLYQWRLYYGSFEDQVYNTTQFISNSTNSLMICYDSMENFFYWVNTKFESFGSLTNVLTSFFQNLIGNAIVLTRYQKTLTDQFAANDLLGLAENFGKLVKLLLLDFQPIENSSLEKSLKSPKGEEELIKYYTRQADIIDQEQYLSYFNENELELDEAQLIETVRNIQLTQTSSATSPGIQKITSLGGLMGFLRGFLNGTHTYKTNNMTQCESKVVSKWDKGVTSLINNTLDGNLFKAGWNVLDMIYNVHPITLSCYTGMKEGFNGLITYGQTLYPSAVMDNVVFNFGNIFDAFRDTVLFFSASSRGEFNLPFEAGFATGEAVWQIMKPPTGTKPANPF